ncbi:hypothetical protein TrLO_g6148 [Triparma laevis f. longispina]|uniref:Uncharacterized protein n=1 Tax=Triparma laevis f. longispina TaxID=1714387 RepID=A0A9W7DLA1_9STRA|nr:hypothetical protein TrLO_g6148 [Triparma laevis f. longispina]
MDSNDVNAVDNALADSSSALAKFRARRRKAAIAMAIASFQQGFILGSSVIVGALLRPFNGLYAVASALCVTYWVGSEVLLPVFAKYPKKRRPIMIALICLLPCAFAVGGGAVSASGIQESTVLLYVAFSVLLGFGLSILELFSRLEVLQWYSVDGTKSTGITIVGAALGASALFFTLYSGWVNRYASLEVTLYTIAGLNLVLSVPHFVQDKLGHSIVIMFVATAISCVFYGICPLIIGTGTFEYNSFSWRLVGFVIAKSVIEGCFAIQTTIFGSTLVDIAGAQNASVMLRTQWPVAGPAGFAGPASCFIITFARYYSGMNFSEAFHLFFFLACGLAALSCASFVYLYVLQLKLRDQMMEGNRWCGGCGGRR